MKSFEHMNFEKRKIISNELSSRKSNAKTIASLIYADPSAVSKEIKRNRYISREAINKRDSICKKTLRFPYVCNGCVYRTNNCLYRQYRYEASRAQRCADYKLVVPRRGIDLSPEEFEILDKKIKDGIANNKSIYQIVTEDNEITVSVPTVYKYINDKILTTSRKDLPYATKYKKRKAKIKEYEYPSNTRIDRSNRTFIDYLVFKRDNPNCFITQMDFLGTIKTDSKCILTFVIPEIHFCFIRIIDKRSSYKMVSFFNQLEEHLGIDSFKKLFSCILTDRDPCFSDYMGIEFSNTTGEERTKLFYCDAFKSNQKGSVENMNKQLRKYFPKGRSIQEVSDLQVKTIMSFINNQNKPSLSAHNANQAFVAIYGEEILDKLYTFTFNEE